MTDLSSWTAYFQGFWTIFNGSLFTLALRWLIFIPPWFWASLWAMSTSKRPFLRVLAPYLCRILPKYFPLFGAVCHRLYGLPLISEHTITIPVIGQLYFVWDSITAPISLRLFVQGFSLFLAVRWRPPCPSFTYISAMRLIILPQAFRIILLPLTNQIVNLIKNTLQ